MTESTPGHPKLLEYLDDRLAPDERREVEEWIAADPSRVRLVDEHRRVWDALGEAFTDTSPGPSSEFRARTVELARDDPGGALLRGRFTRAAGLLAAALLVAAVVFPWLGGGETARVDDETAVTYLDEIENLEWLEDYAEELDLIVELDAMEAFDRALDRPR